VTTILVIATDPVWQDRSSWVWKAKPSFATDFSRVFLVDQL
jgi:hypothetical protein